MSKNNKRKKKNAQPKADRYAGMSASRRKLHQRADRISDQFAAVDKTANRILLVILVVLALLWAFKVIPTLSARYAIIMVLGCTLGLNGIVAYKEHRWTGFFLMVFGTILMLGNFYMLVKS